MGTFFRCDDSGTSKSGCNSNSMFHFLIVYLLATTFKPSGSSNINEFSPLLLAEFEKNLNNSRNI